MSRVHYIKPKRFVVCPKCRHVFLNRVKQCCPQCGVPLYYMGEHEVYADNEGFVYDHDGWLRLEGLKTKKR